MSTSRTRKAPHDGDGLRATNRESASAAGVVGDAAEMDLARSIQEVTEEVMLKVAAFAHRETKQKNLCLAGGAALNCVANGRIVREGPFDEVWVQPAAGDAGGALGVALAVWHRYLGNPRSSPERTGQWVPALDWSGADPPPYADGMKGAYLGPHYSSETIHRFPGDSRPAIPRDRALDRAGCGR